MRRTTEQDERITRYLLGDLPENEEAAVEREYFTDPEKFEEVWAAENDLVDRYTRDRLSRGERELFERNYLQSPKHHERVAVSRMLLDAAERLSAESGVAKGAIAPAPSGWMETMNALFRPRFLAPATAFLLMLSFLSWLALERSRLNEEIEKTRVLLSDQQRQGREITERLAAEREQNHQLKSELDSLLETISSKPPQASPSILSFLLTTTLATRTEGADPQPITIQRETDLVRLRINVKKDDSRVFQASVRKVGGPQVWSQRSLKPRAGAITITLPADKLTVDDYILTLSATTPTSEPEEINRYAFRVLRK